MKFLLDSNAVIAMLRRDPSVVSKLLRRPPTEFAVPAIAAHELYYGAYRGQRRADNLARVDALQFEVLEFDREDARCAGELRAELAASGTPIGPYDVLIAGQAIARDLTLITHNMREFSRVPGLKVEDWQAG
jgi:tRNA(fMet)-specific endonuclease VapC